MFNLYEEISARILEALEAGVVPWQKPWLVFPLQNALSRKPYRGINTLLLGLQTQYQDPRWLTFRQALELGGHVRQGEKGTRIYFWKFHDCEEEEETPRRRAPLLRAYTVFNVEQCEELNLPPLPELPARAVVLEAAEAVIEGMPQRPTLTYGGERAFYNPIQDRVGLPERNRFETTEAFYATAFHELGHATGHASRLCRPEVAQATSSFGSESYSREELVAEMTAGFVCGSLGLATEELLRNQTAYIASWLEVLRSDRRMLIKAAGEAQRAADYILGTSVEESEATVPQ